MSSFQFRPAKRERVSLLLGVAGASGSGKTYSAMLLAKGMAGGKRFAVIDTEARRALHYSDQGFEFDHLDFAPPFSPDRYAEAIAAADAAGYPVIVIDSASHEHAGDGGILDLQEAELQRMAGDDWKKREAVRMSSWIRPKMQHKKFVQKLLQVRAHLILCMRAESKIEMVKVDGKTVVQPKQTLTSIDGWIPIAEKSLPFELTASFLLTPDHPGIPKPIKIQRQHMEFFPAGKPITEAAGVALAAWAAGGVAAPKSQPAASSPATAAGEHRGVCGAVLERPGPRGMTIFDAQVNGEIFSTTDEQLAIRARQFAGIPVVARFKPTPKGGRELTAIFDAEDPNV